MSQGESQSAAHAADLKRALLAVRDLRRRVEELESGVREPVAIVGMACRFPGGATTPEAFWEVLRQGRDVTREIPSDRWDIDAFHDPDPDAPGKMYVRRGGFLEGPVDRFDPGFFGISHKEADAMDPLHRMLLEMAWEALERAGIPGERLSGSDTGVFVGISGSDYDLLQRENLAEINSYRGTGTISSVAAGRISYFLGTHGPNVAVDTACSSALVAVSLAVDALRSGRCSLALAGTSHLILSPEGTIMLSKLRALSPRGRCRTFDAGADGYARAEGGGMFVLKKLSRAQADGDPILAVIRGVAVNNDGRSSGLTVPNPAAQRAVIEAALQDGGVAPVEVGYVEAHGTGTPLGDPIELRALSAALGPRPADRPLRVGSVKTNLGHAEAAAGAAALAKVILSLQHRQIPPHLHLETPTPHVDWQALGLEVPTRLTEWAGGRRIAGLSGFGFSGTNAHILVEEAPQPAPDPRPRRPAEVVLLSARDRNAVRELAGLYREALAPEREGAAERMAELAATSVAGRSVLPFRAAAVGADPAGLAAELEALAAGEGDVSHVRGSGEDPVAFLFTGQGAQYPGMAAELHATSPIFREALERCATIADRTLDRPLLPLLLDPAAGAVLGETRYTQPALFAVEYALAELWRGWGLEPAYVLGHSLGEYVAATVAGVMELEEALPLVVERGRLMSELPSGGRMTAVMAPEEQVRAALAGIDGVGIAAANAPESIVISGTGEGVARAVERLAASGVRTKDLEVSHAFHSVLMEPVLEPFEEAVRGMTLRPPVVPLVSNLTGDLMTAGEATDPARWRRHVREPVLFSASIRRLAELGVRTFVEVGPHPTLSGLGAQSVGSGVTWVPSLRRGMPAWPVLCRSAGELFRSGHPLDPAAWTRDFAGRRGALAPTYPFQRERFWFAAESSMRRPAGIAGVGGIPTGHPLLGAELRSPAIEGWVFESLLSPDQPRWIADHRVQGTVVVPGAAWLEMMVSGAERGPGWKGAELSDVSFEVPLSLAPGEPVRCQVVLGPVRDGSASVRIVSSPASEGPTRWVVHARGVLRPGATGSEEVTGSKGAVPAAGVGAGLETMDGASSERRQVPVAELYRRLAARGLDYGEAFRGLQEAAVEGGAAWGRIELPTPLSAQAAGYGLHPAVLDAAFQLLELFAEQEGGRGEVLLPAGVDRLRVIRPGIPAARVRAVRRDDADGDGFAADLQLTDETGATVVELVGYTARRLRRSLGSEAEGKTVLRVAFEEVDSPGSIPDLAGTWLVLEDGGGVMSSVAAALELRGGRALRVGRGVAADDGSEGLRPPSEDPWRRVRAEVEAGGPLQGILHGWALDACLPDRDPEQLLRRILEVTAPVPGRLPLPGADRVPVGLRVLTRGAAGGGDVAVPQSGDGAALWGLLRVVAAEYPELPVRAVDLDPGADPPDGEALLDLLLGESPEDRLVLREGAIRAPRLAPEGRSGGLAVPRGSYRIELSHRGTLDAIGYTPVPRRPPGPGEVEVRVQATGLNFRDVLNVLGMYPGDPGVPGVEFAGVVVGVGEGVEHVSPGDPVIGIGEGAFGAYVTGPGAAVSPSPAALTRAEAATIPLAFLTAELGLTDLAGLRAGERVLIHAAAGGVGQAAVQLALARGAEVFATAGSEAKRAYLRGQGVEHVFDSRSPSFADAILEATGGEGVDVVLNSLTGELLQRSLELLGPGGRFLELGKAELLDADEVSRTRPGVSYHAYDLGGLLAVDPDAFQELFTRVTARFDRGELTPLALRTWPAEGVVDAFRYMAQARHIGKLVVTTRTTAGDREPLLDPEGAYLVTGALGGVGRAAVEWLAEAGAGAVVLNGRSAPDAAARAWMDGVQARGHTRLAWAGGDVALPDEASAVVEAAAREAPLRGVFHVAGILDDALLPDQSPDRFERVLRPKVAGAVNLHRLTRRHPLDHFVLFSSVAAVLGAAGQGNYASANAFLGALARDRRRQGLPALAVHWGAWEGAGMAGRLGDRERRYLEEGGVGFLDPGEALTILEELLRSGCDEAAAVRMDWGRAAARAGRLPPLVSGLVAPGSASDVAQEGSPGEAPDRAELLELPGPERAERVGAYLRRTLVSVLGIRGREVEDDTEIAHLGFDSLMAMELRNRVEAEVGVLVPVARLLGSTTPAELTKEVLEQLGGAEEGPLESTAAAGTETFEF